MHDIGTLKLLIKDMLDMNSSKIETRIINNHSLKDEDGKPTSWRITIDRIDDRDIKQERA